MKRENPIPQSKIKIVKDLADLIKNKKTILLASIKNIPGSQFQEIGKKMRGKAIVKVPKKNLLFRALDASKNEELKKLKEQILDSVAILFSDLDSFDLAGDLLKSTSPAKAKIGQEAPMDIEVKAGMTELVPGPAISELGAVGLQIKVTGGKLEIVKDKIIVKEGDKISAAAADVMGKLDIKPFTIGFIPCCAFDTKENKLYLEINIDPERTLEELKTSSGKALSFALEIGYLTEDTVKLMIQKAGSHERKLSRVVSGEPEPEVVVAPEGVPSDEGKEQKQETKPEEEKAPAAEGLGALFG